MGAVYELTAAQTDRLHQVGMLLRSSHDLFVACWSEDLRTPLPGSPAAKAMAERQQCATVDRPWPEHLVAIPGTAAINLLHKAANLIRGIGGNLIMGDLMDVPHVVARQAVEYLARATWIIDPDATHRIRCARCWVTEVRTFDAQTDVLKLAIPDWKSSTARRENKAKRAKLIAQLGEWFTVTYTGKEGSLCLDGERNLRFEELATHWSTVNQISGDGALVYAILALRSHPQGYNANLDNLVDLGDGTAQRLVNLEDLDRLAQLLAASFYSAMSGIVGFHGRDRRRVAAWLDDVTRVFPEAANP